MLKKMASYVLAVVCVILISSCTGLSADQRIQYTEAMVGANHPTKADTLNRLALVEHNTDGTHSGITGVESKLSVTTVSFGADGDTTLYTVPAGKRCVITKAIIIAAADAGTTVLSIGQNGAETDFLNGFILNSLNAQYDVLVPPPAGGAAPYCKSYAAGTVIEAKVTSHAGAAGNTIILFGYLY